MTRQAIVPARSITGAGVAVCRRSLARVRAVVSIGYKTCG
jgi:hypothetical protein